MYEAYVVPEIAAPLVLAAIPDGWAKVDGEWVRIVRMFEDNATSERCAVLDR